MISKNLQHTLLVLNNKLKNSKIKYRIVGSTSLILQGIDIPANDIDILTDQLGAEKITKLLKEYQISELKFSRTEKFASYKADFEINNIKIEVMGDLEVNVDGKWIKRVLEEKNKILTKIDVNGKKIVIPITTLESHLSAYKSLNRNKDIDKIKKIEERLKTT